MQHADPHAALVRRVLEAASLPQPAQIRRVPEGIGNHVYFAEDVVVRLGTGSDAAMFNIGEIQNVLDLLSGRLSWVDAETALADARETYEAAFLGDRHARILDRVT